MLALQEDAHCYPSALLEVAKVTFHRPFASLGLVGILESKHSLRKRIERLANLNMPRKAGLTCFSIAAICAFAAVAVPMGEPPPALSRIADSRLHHESPATHSVKGKKLAGNDLPSAVAYNPALQTFTNSESGRMAAILEKEVSIRLDNAQVGTTLLKLAEVFGVNIVADKSLPALNNPLLDDLGGHTNLDHVKLADFFEYIAQKHNLQFQVGNELVWVLPGTNKGPQQSSAYRLPNQPSRNREPISQVPLSQSVLSPMTDLWNNPYIISLDVDSGNKTIANRIESTNENKKHDLGVQQEPTFEIVSLSTNGLVEYSITSGLTTAMNGVRVAYNGTLLTAERLELNQRSGEALATGKVRIQRDGRVWTGENIRYNFKTREIEVRQSEAGAPPSKLEPLKEASKARAEPHSTRELIDPSTGLSGSELLTGIPSNTAPLFTRRFRLDPATVREGLERINSSSPAGTQPDSIGVNFDIAAGLRKVFLDAGISLEPPKSLSWSEAQGNLIVRTTQQELDIIEQILQLVCITPPQINIKLKVVEVDDATIAYVMNWMAAQDSGSTITSGHGKLGREIKTAVTSLTNTISFFVEGVVQSPQMPEITRSLEQKGAREILPPASVTTLSGRQTEFQAAKTVSMIDWQPGIPSSATNLFRTRPVTVGPVVDIVPYVYTNGYDIELTVICIDKEFLGYDDPGGFLGKQGVDQNTSSVLPVPHFRLRQVMTSRLVPDGHTLILGGIADDSDVVQLKKLKDGVPVLGDLPLLGRFFRSESESPSKKNLLFFITPIMIDPAGNPIH